MKSMNTIVCWVTIMVLFPLAGMICSGDESEPIRETASSAEFYPPGKVPPPLKQKNAKPARLFQSSYMKSVALVDYALQMTIDTDNHINNNSSGKGGSWSSSSSSGSVKYIPRISITAKNNPLPKSCLLVIEYFSRDILGKSKSRKECVEHISIPDIAKGESATVDANGVEFYKWEHKSNSSYGYNYKQGGGLELYGVIVSFFADDKLLIQLCMPQSLTKECADTISAPQVYDDTQARHYYGW